MKKLVLLACTFLLVVNAKAQTIEVRPLQLEISLDTTSVCAHSELGVRVVLQNLGRKSVYVDTWSLGRYFAADYGKTSQIAEMSEAVERGTIELIEPSYIVESGPRFRTLKPGSRTIVKRRIRLANFAIEPGVTYELFSEFSQNKKENVQSRKDWWIGSVRSTSKAFHVKLCQDD